MLGAKTIPNIIHFVWIGGDEPIPKRNRRVIINWLRKNDDYEIHLWIGKDLNDDKNITNLVEVYKKLFRTEQITEDELARIHFNSTIILPRPILPDIQHSLKCAEYEMEKLRPNYGGSSDIIRYWVLFEKGGGYVDSDVGPGKDALKVQLPHVTYLQHQLYVDHLSQEVFVTDEQLGAFLIESQSPEICVGNDTFITTPNNPLMQSFLINVGQNYILDKFDDQLFAAYNANDIEEITLKRTGPKFVRNVLERYVQKGVTQSVKKLNIQGEEVKIKPVRCSNYQLTQPLLNQLLWLRVGVDTGLEIDPAIDRAIDTIVFEAKNFKVIRLDDHIDDIIDSTENLYTETEVEQKLITKLLLRHDINYSAIKIAQLLYDRQTVKDFYRKHQLLDKTYSSYNAPNCDKVIEHVSKSNIFGKINIYAANEIDLQRLYEKDQLIQMIRDLSRIVRFMKIRLSELCDDIKDKKSKPEHTKELEDFLEALSFSCNCLKRPAEYINKHIFSTRHQIDLSREFNEINDTLAEIRTVYPQLEIISSTMKNCL